MKFYYKPYTEEEFQQIRAKEKRQKATGETMGEILLVVDSKVTDTATFKTLDDRKLLVRQFLNLKLLIEQEHPYSNVRIDIRETVDETNL